MKIKNIIFLLFIALLIKPLALYAGQQPKIPDHKMPKPAAAKLGFAPMAVVKENHFKFEPVVEGSIITHEFIIVNKGNSPLSIDKIKTSCGCTTAYYPDKIEPGTEGRIKIKGNTKWYGGKTFSKTITVYTNDPKQKTLFFYLSGPVKKKQKKSKQNN